MAPRTFWKGYLKLSLVTCRVSMLPAVSESGKVRFHNLDRKTQNRVVNRYVDAVTGKPVDDEDQVKGYPRGEDDYVLFEDEEIDEMGLESSRTIDIDSFVPAESIGWIWYDRPHYLLPDDKVSEEAFCVIRDAMADTGTAGISRVVMYRRERAVLLLPRDKGLMVWTLRYGDELRDAGDYFGKAKTDKPAARALPLMKDVIAGRTRDWDPDMANDPVQDKLLDIIAARKKGRRKTKAVETAKEQPSNVIDIMSALKKSLEQKRKSPAK
jgi:DNA end-binding protein Ku